MHASRQSSLLLIVEIHSEIAMHQSPECKNLLTNGADSVDGCDDIFLSVKSSANRHFDLVNSLPEVFYE